ncbi:hypothetical protein D779_2657 [Imhoffiella purpurea]|uniref:Uncharacterized protein n=1 Tax=Imhoffiella purpurea TaxID=1249627 RepID=W9VC15_9GAMM|nr:hypothetical protein D779_2657 [Imhoffiella purpurea]
MTFFLLLALLAVGSSHVIADSNSLTGRNVAFVQFQNGSIAQTGGSTWTEYDNSGNARFSFQETQRDDWSVYLNDASRNVQMQLDLHRKWISYGEDGGPKRDLYKITDAKAVTGRNVSQVQVPNGKYVKTGANVWSEYDASGKPTYKFRETNRDAWSVYLNDPSRNVQLQLDLHRKWVSYGEDGGPKRDLYRITSAKG